MIISNTTFHFSNHSDYSDVTGWLHLHQFAGETLSDEKETYDIDYIYVGF